jgi:hyaluronoglucosaminidase
LKVRGVIEGFYGRPWRRDERIDLIRFCGGHGLNTWVHAPKDDPYHRERWRDPYPDDELQRFAELVAEGRRHGVELVYALAPGLDIDAASAADISAMQRKCAQLQSAGVRSFHLLWDDLERETAPSADEQALLSNRFARELAQEGPLVVCPMGYAGTDATPYRSAFASLLDDDIVVYWTGPEVVSPEITREQLDATSRSFDGHELLLWDNFPANDFSPNVLFLGPLTGRDPRLADGNVRGIVANAMVQAVPSKLALATVAEWTRDPVAYEPVAAYERALREHGAEVVDALRRLGGTADGVARPQDVAALVAALAGGVDAATGVALLEPFV